MGLIRYLASVVGGTIRLVFSAVGVLVILIGIILSLTVVGLIVGLPLIVLGMLIVGLGAVLAPRRRVVLVREYRSAAQPTKSLPKKKLGKVVDADFQEVKK